MAETKSYKRYGVPLEIHLTDSLPSVVSRRRKRFMIWHLMMMPVRMLRGMISWILEGERHGKPQRLRKPPGMIS